MNWGEGAEQIPGESKRAASQCPLPLRARRGRWRALLGLIFLFRIFLRAVFSVFGRRSPWGQQTASLGSGLSPYRPLPPKSRPTSAGGFLFLTSASMTQSTDSLADGLPGESPGESCPSHPGQVAMQPECERFHRQGASTSPHKAAILIWGSLSFQQVFLLYREKDNPSPFRFH